MNAESEQDGNSSSGGPSWIVRIALWTLLVLILILLVLPLLASGRIETFSALLLGWIQFLKRTVPRISWNWDLVGMGVVCSVAILIASHWLLNWIASTRAAARGQEIRWPLKWTVSGLMATGICFLVGMSVGGIAHQAGWLFSQTESWYEANNSVFADLHQINLAFRAARQDAADEVNRTRLLMRSKEDELLGRHSKSTLLTQRFHVLLILDSPGKVAGAIIFPRNAAPRPSASIIYTFGEIEGAYLPPERLSELLEKHQDALLAL